MGTVRDNRDDAMEGGAVTRNNTVEGKGDVWSDRWEKDWGVPKIKENYYNCSLRGQRRDP